MLRAATVVLFVTALVLYVGIVSLSSGLVSAPSALADLFTGSGGDVLASCSSGCRKP